tara:strand:- start:356 stop:472 length:117 start_codon:yes stop_codon:yes gene_type:complete
MRSTDSILEEILAELKYSNKIAEANSGILMDALIVNRD